MGGDCAFDFLISPRSALTTMPNATDAITIAMVDKKRLVRGFIVFDTPYGLERRQQRRLFSTAWRPTSRISDESADEMFRGQYDRLRAALKQQKAPLARGYLTARGSK